MFELYEKNYEFFIQIRYKKTASDDPSPLEIPKCGKMCPLKKFSEIFDAILPKEDHSKECALK